MAWGYPPLPGGTAKRILARDGGVCYRCGGPATEADHIVNVAAGGTHDDDNLAAICPPCHRFKSERERIAGMRRRSTRIASESHPGRISRDA